MPFSVWRRETVAFFAAALLGVTVSCGGGGGGSGDVAVEGGGGVSADGGMSVAARTGVIDPGDATCPYGGILVETGIDENGNGVLDADEVDDSQKVCHGAPGSGGTDGLSALVQVADEPAGANCTAGGKKIDFGIDSDSDGVLDTGEVVSTDYVCNGVDGANGADGANGLDGKNSLVALTPEPSGANCPGGGVRIDTGIDTDGDGTLGSGEVLDTAFVCNGADVAAAGWHPVDRVAWAVTDGTDTLQAYGYLKSPPAVSMDASGNAVFAWVEGDGRLSSPEEVRVRFYEAGVGLGAEEQISDGYTAGAGSPAVAMDASGNALVAWLQYSGARWTVWGAYNTNGFGWGSGALELYNTVAVYDGPQVAAASGKGVVVWIGKPDLGTRTVYAKRYGKWTLSIFEPLWHDVEPLSSPVAGDSFDPKVAMTNDGTIIVAWTQFDGTNYSVVSSRWDGSAWSNVSVAVGLSQEPAGLDLAVDGNGNALLVWAQVVSNDNRGNATYDIYASSLSRDGGWAVPDQLAADVANPVRQTWDGTAWIYPAGDVDWLRVAADDAGNAVAVWPDAGDIWADRYDGAGGAWEGAQLIETSSYGTMTDPRVGMDAQGNAVVVWEEEAPRTYELYPSDRIWTNRYESGSGWGVAEVLYDQGGPYAPNIAVSANGTATVVWQSGTTDDQGNTYDFLWIRRWGSP